LYTKMENEPCFGGELGVSQVKGGVIFYRHLKESQAKLERESRLKPFERRNSVNVLFPPCLY